MQKPLERPSEPLSGDYKPAKRGGCFEARRKTSLRASQRLTCQNPACSLQIHYATPTAMLKYQEQTEKTGKTPCISYQQSLRKEIDGNNCLLTFQSLAQAQRLWNCGVIRFRYFSTLGRIKHDYHEPQYSHKYNPSKPSSRTISIFMLFKFFITLTIHLILPFPCFPNFLL